MVNPELTVAYYKRALLNTHEDWTPIQGYYHYRGPELTHPLIRKKMSSIRKQLTYEEMENSEKDLLDVLLMALFQLGVQQGLELSGK